MPIYEYECQSCGEAFDKLIRSLNKMPSEIACPTCQSVETRRLVSMPAVHIGGEGGGSIDYDAIDTTPAQPPVFGRKELKEAQESKRQIKEQVKYEKEQDRKKR